jgi:hypothetical protein
MACAYLFASHHDQPSTTCLQEDCGGCAYSSSRVKGYWSGGGNTWAWLEGADLSNPTSCPPPVQEQARAFKYAEMKSWAQRGSGELGSCPAAGMYTVNQPGGAMVRGDAGDPTYGCLLHHFLGWLLTGEHFEISGPCDPSDPTCFWCVGQSYGDVNEGSSVICTEVG